MSDAGVGAPSRGEAGAVAVAFFLASALGLALLGLVARWLDPEANAAFLALWGLVFTFGSVVGSVEQEVSRQSAFAALRGDGVPRGTIQMIAVTTAGLVLSLALLVALPAGRRILGDSVEITALTVAALLAFGPLIWARGALVGFHEIRRYVVVLLGEAVTRIAAAVVVIVLLGSRPSLALAAVLIVVGCFSWLPVLPWLVRRLDVRSPRLSWRRVTGTVGALAIANGFSALVIAGFPTVATLMLGRSAELAELFAVLTIARVPLVLFAPVQTMTVPIVLRWMRDGRAERLRRALQRLDAATLALALVGGAAAYLLGPIAVRLLMGDQYDPTRIVCAGAVAASCLLTAVLVRAAVLVALERPWLVAGSWFSAVLSGALVMAVLPIGDEARGLGGFAAASVAAYLASSLALRHVRGRSPRPGSGDADVRG